MSAPCPASRSGRAWSCRHRARGPSTTGSGPRWSGRSGRGRITALMRLAPDLVYVDGRLQRGLGVDVADGRIVTVGPDSGETGALKLAGKALLPGTVNAHCHSFQSLLRGLGDDLDFMSWRDRGLYPYSAGVRPDARYI